ncbi:hypothetical protein K438DRAFT_1747195 [Mycena galopus ATCC 62051]|nr:hypothetical protein K438DRAFT_1747195 [Mycena galopus ATCC 62051]
MEWNAERKGREGRKEWKTAGAGGAPVARYDGRELKKGSVLGGRGCGCKLGTYLGSIVPVAVVNRSETFTYEYWLSVIGSKSGRKGIAGNAAAPAPAYAWNVVDGDGNGSVCQKIKDHRGPALRSKDAR